MIRSVGKGQPWWDIYAVPVAHSMAVKGPGHRDTYKRQEQASTQK